MSTYTEHNPQHGPPPRRNGHRQPVAMRRPALAAAAISLVATAAILGSTAAQATGSAKPLSAVRLEAGLVAPDLVKPGTPTNGVYLGADPNFDPNKSQWAQAGILAGQIGRPLGIVSFYTAFAAAPPTQGFATVAATGSVPMVSMHCGPPDSDVVAGKWDSQIRASAEQYKAWGGPVFLRWFWEMNLPKVHGHQTCLGTGVPLSSQEAGYVAAYQHIWRIFQAVGATNVAFIWAPSAAYHAPDAAPFYPGNAYVDWIGADLYDRPSHGVFETVFNGYSCTTPASKPTPCFYQEWSNIKYDKKPMVITETGAIGAAVQQGWLGGIASDLQAKCPLVKGVVYVDAIAPLGNYVLSGVGLSEFTSIGHEAYYSSLGPQDGYLFTTTGGGVHSYGTPYYGSMAGKTLPAPIVGMAENRLARGYWLVGADGSIYPFGSAANLGSMRGKHLNKPIVGMASTPSGRGYWLVATDGGIFSFGDAKYYGSMGGKHLNKPIVGMTSSADGHGYWFVASDGGIFTFGDAKFRGSTGGMHLNKPIVGMSSTRDGVGYWLVASDGGIFTFGDAHFVGSLGATHLNAPITGMAPDLVTGGYRLLTARGVVWQFPGFVAFNPPSVTTTAIGLATVGGG